MIIITVLQAITFIVYVTFLLIYFKGPLPSISESWYRLPGFSRNLFTFFCWILGFLMFFQTNGDSGLFFLSGAGLVFVGGVTQFKKDLAKSNLIHPIGAIFAIIGGLAGLIVERHTYLPLIVFSVLTLSIIVTPIKNKTWWIENSAFLTILSGLLFF